MPVHNEEISDILEKTADLLEIKGDNPFRIRAYRNAARTVASLTHNLVDMVNQGQDLSHLPGIGKDLAGKLEEITKTGTFTLLKQLEKEMDIDIMTLGKIRTLGAQRIKILYKKLGVHNIKDLEKVVKQKKVRALEGFGEKTEKAILDGIKRLKSMEFQIMLFKAERIAHDLVSYLRHDKDIYDIIEAGSFRRKKETIKDLDILVTCKDPMKIMKKFAKYEDVVKVDSLGEKKSSVFLRQGLQADLRIVPRQSYGSALHYFTGSKEHNIAVRNIAVKKKLKINEYGVFKNEKQVAGKTEKSVYEQVGLPYIEPELRENRGEIELGLKNKLPKLVTLEDIKGDLHLHSNYSDGSNTIKEMALAAKEFGHEYIAITDHSKRVTVANGLDEKRLYKQIKEIDKLNESISGITVFKGIEVDILENGKLDLPDSILKELDVVVCAVHSKFNLSYEKQTERILRAMDNPYFNILAHPTGRLINQRAAYEVDIERIIKKAKHAGCFMELNAHPDRLDLNDVHCMTAKENGVKVAISTDAHSAQGLKFLRFGINQARRGWISSKDVINTRSLTELKKLLKRK
ncbi:DNA polymerase/3'-5' exonuclease PolX [bacterium]